MGDTEDLDLPIGWVQTFHGTRPFYKYYPMNGKSNGRPWTPTDKRGGPRPSQPVRATHTRPVEKLYENIILKREGGRDSPTVFQGRDPKNGEEITIKKAIPIMISEWVISSRRTKISGPIDLQRGESKWTPTGRYLRFGTSVSIT